MKICIKWAVADSSSTNINWQKGSAENTNLKDNSADWISMASSFHWANFDKALKNFIEYLFPMDYSQLYGIQD